MQSEKQRHASLLLALVRSWNYWLDPESTAPQSKSVLTLGLQELTFPLCLCCDRMRAPCSTGRWAELGLECAWEVAFILGCFLSLLPTRTPQTQNVCGFCLWSFPHPRRPAVSVLWLRPGHHVVLGVWFLANWATMLSWVRSRILSPAKFYLSIFLGH